MRYNSATMSNDTLVTLGLEEKRQLLRLLRIKFGFEVDVPREVAIDRICEKGLIDSSESHPFSAAEVSENLVKRFVPLRLKQISDGLERLHAKGRVRRDMSYKPPKYFLTVGTSLEIARELEESRTRVDRVIGRLFRGLQSDKDILRKFLLGVLSEVFSRFGHEWVKAAAERVDKKDILNADQVRLILQGVADAVALPKTERKIVLERTLRFFREGDPEFDFLQFTFAQSYFISQLLAIDGAYDPLSIDAFKGSVFYLDTNVVIAALLPGAKRFRVFREVLDICRRLGATLLVGFPTYQEVRNVVAFEETDVAPDLPPEN